MPYASLAHCVRDLEEHNDLRRIDAEVDPYLEIGCIQRLAFRAKAPALLFTNVRGTDFPLLCNLFGTRERLRFIFRNELPALERLFAHAPDLQDLLRHPLRNCRTLLSFLPHMLHTHPRQIPERHAPLLKESCSVDDLPKVVSWPKDGGPFITLPVVYSEDPKHMGMAGANLGMYRIQLRGNAYVENEVGLHYQIHRGIGVHHAHALQKGVPLPVHIYVGGPPALTLAAVMPLPEGVSELTFAGLLHGQSVSYCRSACSRLPFLAEADFCLQGCISPVIKDEGPFGDHLGYYSKAHPYPTVFVEHVFHRPHAIWPFTTVGRPPQEDTQFGEFIHELTAPLLPTVFHGISEVHAVDAAGVHPLLLALGEDRYTAYESRRKPRELLTEALHLLGTSQTSLAKYLLISARDDAPQLSVRDVPGFFRHMLERTDLAEDLHFLTRYTADTLDYTGGALHEGSKLIWASTGNVLRTLGCEFGSLPLPEQFSQPLLVAPGIIAVQGPPHTLPEGTEDPLMHTLADVLSHWDQRESYPLIIVADNSFWTARSFENFLWVTFTRSDPATDIYGAEAVIRAKHWSCRAPLIIDARKKTFHAEELEEDPDVLARVEAMAVSGGPLEGLF